jgi:pantoate--beta-alanine ligase
MSVIVVTSIEDMRKAVAEAKTRGAVGLVPTMGALHEGHLSLVRAAKKACDTVVVSIFVNPTQFGPKEDYGRYPRTLEADLELLEREQVAFVFAPSKDEMYPAGRTGAFVDVGEVGDRLDGATRVGHFPGVATVVAKLFHIISPDMAFFGQKDAAQVAVLRAMVRDLDFPVELVVCPTVRERDGLAMSSRNRYLTPEQRLRSLVISRALSSAQNDVDRGVRNAATLRNTMLRVMQTEPSAQLEYVEVVDPCTLEPIVGDLTGPALLAIAAKIGETRLIDNVVLEPAMEVVTCA